MNSETRACQNCKDFFALEPAEIAFYEKMQSPLPKQCPNCRNKQRLAFWPFGKFHKRTCDLTGEKIISIYPPGTRFPVYKSTNWYSDSWQPPEMELDLSKPFFNQLYELQSKTPRPHQFGTKNTNCDYSDDVWSCKNAYLSRSLLEDENISYCYRAFYCKDSLDLTYCYHTEQSYDCTYCFKVFNVKHSFDVRDSFDSAFLYDCRNVRNCFMSWNLRNTEYHILNKPYSKEEYLKKIKEFNAGSWSGFEKLRKEFEKRIRDEAIHRTDFNFKILNSDGNYLTECKNIHHSYFFEKGENGSYLFRGLECKDTFESSGAWDLQLALNTNQISHGYNIKQLNYCTDCRDSEYLDFCIECHNCFGCVGLRKKQFCILNKQYSEEKYRDLVTKLREKMENEKIYGEFFPLRMATTGYNLSLAQVYYPETEVSAKEIGSYWEELEKADPTVEIVEPPSDIRDVSDDIVSKGIRCPETGRVFNITKDELSFLRAHHIPIPRHYPDFRTIERFKKLPALHPYEMKCVFCGTNIISYYPKEWNYQKIACHECYQKNVI